MKFLGQLPVDEDNYDDDDDQKISIEHGYSLASLKISDRYHLSRVGQRKFGGGGGSSLSPVPHKAATVQGPTEKQALGQVAH